MRHLQIIITTLIFVFLTVSTGCKENLFDKKISETNYIIVLDQLKEEKDITKDEYIIMRSSIQDIVVIRYANAYGKAITAERYGKHHADITYRDVYYCDIERPKKSNP